MKDRSKKTKVLFIQSQAYFGSDSQMQSLVATNLDPDRFEVHVACNKGGRDQPSASLLALRTFGNLRLRPMSFGPTVNDRSLLNVLRQSVLSGPAALIDLVRLAIHARRESIDIVHGTEKPRDAFYGLLIAKAAGGHALTHLHVKADTWISPLSRWAMKHDDALVGVSDFVCDSFAEMGYDRSKLHTVLNALAHEQLEQSTSVDGVREEFGLDETTPLLLVASRLFPWKGHDELLEALQEVKTSDRPFHLLVVGEDDPRATPGGGSYEEHLRGRVAELGLERHVTFTGFRSDVARLMKASDIYAMPSFEEPCAVVYLEAMAHGVPVVALDNGGTLQIVDNGTTGLLSDPGDISTLAKHLMRLIDNEEERRAMGLAGRRRLAEHFGPRRMAEDFESVYDRVVG